MNIRSHAFLLFAIVLLALPMAVMAKSGHKRVVWTNKANSSTGLYTTKNYFVSHGVSFGVTAMYYYGDVDNEGVVFSGGFNKNNLSYGGSLYINYNIPAGNHCNLKFGLMGGTLNGNNKTKFEQLAEPRDDFRKFKSILIQPAVGVQYYPFSNAGFYLYGGLAVTGSIITNYEFYYYRREGSQKVRDKLEGSTFGILPMVQLGIGYSWRLAESWTMSAEIMVQEGLIDTQYMNLDAYPLAASQNSQGVELGTSFGTWTDKHGNKHIHWNDGWFQVGISVTYQWHNCEHCRMINNYAGIKPSRRR